MSGKTTIECPYCQSKNTKKEGKRKSKHETVQKYFCKACYKNFTSKALKNKTYPAKIILNALSFYNLGHSQQQTSKIVAQKFKIKVPQRTISQWLKEYKEICTFTRLRKQALKLYSPENMLHRQTLSHIQPYTFKCHKAKMDILIKENPQFIALENQRFSGHQKRNAFFSALKDYINKISSDKFPHHIFTYNKDNEANDQRASQLKFEHAWKSKISSTNSVGLKIETKAKNNLACKLTSLALNLAATNKDRHQAIQNFMLINDSTTIAIEIPIYLTNWDAGYYRNQKGFIFPLNNYKTPITGHIDILQIRNGLIHILDYKPDANKINAIEQLTIYALALSRKLNLPLYHFKAAWFDESNYYEFFPLHAVYENRKRKV
ncbi:MAG: PD-(D/E)XK nuclease family protein [Nanoarchaeota archaeon]